MTEVERIEASLRRRAGEIASEAVGGVMTVRLSDATRTSSGSTVRGRIDEVDVKLRWSGRRCVALFAVRLRSLDGAFSHGVFTVRSMSSVRFE
jgi:hypothetical protein